MISWVTQCWGGMGVTTNFQRARRTSTIADWSVPDQESIFIVIDTFKGNNPQTDAEASMNSFLGNLQESQLNKNAAFLLKSLFILDLTVQQRTFLTKIGQYHNSQLLCLENGPNQQISSTVKVLVAQYYEYIKAKAKYYSTQNFDLVRKQTRQNFMRNSTSIQILNEINICFKIQNLILNVSDSFLNGNKSPQIIQKIFSSLLKTYLFCFSIVSLAVKTFISRIPILSKSDLQYLLKLANYFNKDYTRNFLLFIERNKVIDNYKSLKYNELIILDEKIISIIQDQIQSLEREVVSSPIDVVDLPFKIDEQLIIQKTNAADLGANDRYTESDIRSHSLRRKFQISQPNQEDQPQTAFTNYQNFYNESFIVDDQPGSNVQIDEVAKKKKKLITKLSFSKNVTSPDIKKEALLEQSRRFDKNAWESWQNVYCVS